MDVDGEDGVDGGRPSLEDEGEVDETSALALAAAADDLDIFEFIDARLRPAVCRSARDDTVGPFHAAIARVRHGDLPSDAIPLLLDAMIATIPRYNRSSESRKVVLDLLIELYRRCRRDGDGSIDNHLMLAVSRMLENVFKDSPLAALPFSTLFNYLKWTSKLIELSFLKRPEPAPQPGSHTSSTAFQSLISTHCAILEAISLTTAVSPPNPKASAILDQALKTTRRFFHLGREPAIDATLTVILRPSVVDGREGMRHALVIGSAVQCAVHKGWLSVVEKHRKAIMDYYHKSVLAATSKTILPASILSSFDSFFKTFVTAETLETDILSGAERLMLRSPEVIIRIYDSLFRSVDFDVSKIFKEKFADALLTHMKSTSENVRSDALSLFRTLCKKCVDEERTGAIVDIVIKSFSAKSPTPDVRQLYYACLSSLPAFAPVSKRCITSIPQLSSKENTEPALSACFSAYGHHLRSYLLLPTAETPVFTAALTFLTNGLSDAKSLARRMTLLCIETSLRSDSLAAVPEKSLTALVEGCLRSLDKLQAAGVALLDPKKESPLLVEGYLALQWLVDVTLWERKGSKSTISSLLEKKKLFTGLLNSGPTKSWVFNEKYYGKLIATQDDQLAMLRSIISIIRNDELFKAVGLSDSVKDKLPLANALMYLLVASNNREVRRVAGNEVKALVAESDALFQRVCRLGRLGLGSYLLEQTRLLAEPAAEVTAWGDDGRKAARETADRYFHALQCIIPSVSSSSASSVDQNLIDLAVLASHPLLTGPLGTDVWIRLCFRARVDPLHLVSRLGPARVLTWMDVGAVDDDFAIGGLTHQSSEVVRRATLAALTLFTTVEPRSVMRCLVPRVLEGLDDELVRDIRPIDMEIFAGQEGVMVIDVNAKKKGNQQASKEPVRLSIKQAAAEKKGSAGGGSGGGSKASAVAKAEKEAERAQIEKESEIRRRVRDVRGRLLCCLSALEAILRGVLGSLADDGREHLEVWLSRLLDALLGVISRELVVFRNGREVPKGAVLAGRTSIEILKLLALATDRRIGKFVSMGLDVLTLRLVGVVEGDDGLTPEQVKKDLSVSVTKLLVAIKTEFTASNTLSPGGFTFIFPLLSALILRQGRASTMKEKIRTELTMFSSDILLAHTVLGGTHLVPRKAMMHALIELLNRYPRLHGAAREGIFTLCVKMEDAAAEVEEIDEFDDEEDRLEFMDARKQDHADEEAIIDELLDALLSAEPATREAALRAMQHLAIPRGSLDGLSGARVWICRHDEMESISSEAERIWEVWNDEEVIGVPIIAEILSLITHSVSEVRANAGRGLCAALQILTGETDAVFAKLYKLYVDKNAPPTPEYDDYGMVIPESLEKEDDWRSRSGIALALKSCSSVISSKDTLLALFGFLIDTEALGDRDERVRSQLLEAGIAAINASGKNLVAEVLKKFSDYLSKPAGSSKSHDWIRESVVILLGTAAQHLEPTDPRIPQVVERLVDTLKTPSEAVQIAVSECLPPLVKVMPDVQDLIRRLLKLLFDSPKYGDRRGAAYGLAGVVRGKGITSLKEYNVMTSLKDAVEDKKRPERREGALFAYEALSSSLGRLFEPHVVQILPLLLVCYGDTQREVREATHDTCKAIMSKLSGHCVKLVMPAILKALEDKSWRTKTGAIEVLGSMAFLAPKQLSLSLPTIVPRLCEVLADTHMKVHETAKQALTHFGNVIKNPEIQELVPVILAALVDPNAKTQAALTALLDTSFVHYIDAPSLALIVPILQRGLTERVTETKKKAAQIMGQIASLTDQKDLIPYLSSLLPGLKEVLVDPVPEARAIAARALGSMVEKLGESNFPDLVSELFQTLKSETSAVDRFGAAQGLSDVLAGIGIDRMVGLLPDIIQNAMSPRTYVKEGFITLLVYLPTTFGENFQPHLASTIQPILQGLADETETVRDTSLKAGRVIVRNYATTAIEILLPQLEVGLFDENWRIRQSSIQLMGDLLYRIAGISGRADTDVGNEDETLGTEHGRQALVSALGLERYHAVLSSLYIVRSDANAIVRQASLHVWKSIVNNTPRTLKEILPVMMQMVIASMAGQSHEKRGVAARTLGELVRKLGDAVLQEIVPILDEGLDSANRDVREGVCAGMTAILMTAGKTQVAEFVYDCLPPVRKALMDSDPGVREAAALAFDQLNQHMGPKAIDEVLPSLLNELKGGSDGGGSSNSRYALEALKEIMTVKSSVVFPVLIPTLLTTPISSFNARALASLITVAGSALNRRLPAIMTALMDGLEQGDSAVPDIRESLRVLLLSIEESGLSTLMPILEESVAEGTPERIRATCLCLSWFCEGTKIDFSDYKTDWLRRLMVLLRGPPKTDLVTVRAAWDALNSLIRSIAKEDLERYVVPLRRAIARATEGMGPEETLAGFSHDKSLAHVLPVFLQGLTGGLGDVKQESAAGIGDLVRRSTPEGMASSVTSITGPLIRILGEKHSAGVKAAILQTLEQVLIKVPSNLKPFLPQLQRTFVKSLSEPTPETREPGRRCLNLLIALQPRLDPLVVELTTGVRTAEDKGIKKVMWEALFGLLSHLGNGKDINETSRKAIEALVVDGALGDSDDSIRASGSLCFGALCTYLQPEEAKVILNFHIFGKTADSSSWTRLHGMLLVINAILATSPKLLLRLGFGPATLAFVLRALSDDKAPVLEGGIKAAGFILTVAGVEGSGAADSLDDYGDSDTVGAVLLKVISIIRPEVTNADARRMAVKVIKSVAKRNHKLVNSMLGSVIPVLMLCVRDRVIPVKLASERALLYVLKMNGIGDGPSSVLKEYLESVDSSTARSISDYAKRVLANLSKKDSDEETLINNPDEFTPKHVGEAARLIMQNAASPAQIGAFLVALKFTQKEGDPAVIAEVASEMLRAALPLSLSDRKALEDIELVDIVGTGGDGQNTFNVSTASGLIAAGCGLVVAKHGNRASSSSCGSADVLEALGVPLDRLNPATVPDVLEKHRFAFLFSQVFHPAMKHVAQPRREIGVRTIFNLLGPLTNPARPKKVVVGVHSKSLGSLMIQALQLTGVRRAWVVNGELGLDEISPIGKTFVWSLQDNCITEFEVCPADFGLPEHAIETVAGGDAQFNANLMTDLLAGRLTGPILDFVLMNCAALLHVSGKAETLLDGVKLAKLSISSGAASSILSGLTSL